MKNEVKHAMDKIHAPQDLIASTKKAVKDEENTINEGENTKKINIFTHYSWKRIALAASICLVLLGGVGVYKVNNHIVINESLFSASNAMEAGMSLGKIDMDAESMNLKTEQFSEKTKLLNEIWETYPSKIKGITVYIVKGEDQNCYYAAYEKGEQYYLITGNSINLKEFLKYLKENL